MGSQLENYLRLKVIKIQYNCDYLKADSMGHVSPIALRVVINKSAYKIVRGIPKMLKTLIL